MIDVYAKTGGNIIAVEECEPAMAHQYGIVGVGETKGDSSFEITGMVEKPPKGTAPSNFFISGRYILQPEIFGFLSR
ncbi:UTP--glucose-1-phosphate uridylyltransferase, partial [Mycobacterium tuberculosis]|nr:UTP--glucose-1-phosphate uridylyltransferase [Mycobacterium tuberculosis]